ncbi:MAG: hypothetical protein A2X13_07435 [Bacteroidetes bacterium GWC2_33_15]|nr:MAG: hypothetical protein A2X10_01290 [Bacteroidetes bacterium GWA2_33_15]OFX48619.1 MAG: hypothetical protein A2X13_07435 [Bacteroidetes bacterium GWC2_33_15]OFX64593.1 MAG: hypothetical protein A2X15_05025 [Bacteroidetes bacterium GWB2_32_14]OFX67989.1 MAG: hypothetical protein A2X14_01750 [Bacteroidetes bacterium GWD2_33_33]HAN18223.1 nuclear transport factor 2 family protein [Bacteroidales bacterium]
MSYFNKAKELFRMIENGKMLDALDKFYHTDMVVIQADGKKRIGIEENKNYEKYFLNNIQEIFGAELLAITSDEERGITMVEYWVHIKFKDGSRKKYEEISVQYWKDDKIIKERFYEGKS